MNASTIATRPAASTAGIPMPRIGQPLADGIFAGIARGADGDHALVLLAEAPRAMKWSAAMKWAKDQGADLPTRAEQSVIFGNLRSEFDGGWYWSSAPYAGYEGYAWSQSFTSGTQDNTHKVYELRARPVRRLPLL
jgi:hypothetical protein